MDVTINSRELAKIRNMTPYKELEKVMDSKSTASMKKLCKKENGIEDVQFNRGIIWAYKHLQDQVFHAEADLKKSMEGK